MNLTNAALILNSGGTLTLSASNSATGSLSLTNGTLGYGPNNLVSLAGALSLGGTDYLTLTGLLASSSTGTVYTLVTGSSPVVGFVANNWIVTGSTNSRQQYSVGTSGDALTLSVTGVAGNLIWTGTGGTPNTWDTNTSPNWYNTATLASDKFQSGDNVTFTDSAGSATANVVINNTVLPGSVTVSNTAVNYTFSGSGSIGGSTALMMNGPGVLTVATSNNYTGGTFINGGTLKVGNANALPSGATAGNVVLSGTGGVLDLNGTPLTFINGLSGGGAAFGQVINSGAGTAALSLVNGGAAATFSGTIADNNGSGGQVALIMSGAGGLQNLSGSNSYSGGTTVSAGTLQVGSASALGTGALAANGGVVDLAGFSVTVGSFSGAASTVTNSAFSPSTLTINQSIATTFGGKLADGANPLALTMAGSGILTLTAATTYSGSTTVTAGTLALGVTNAVPSTAGIIVGQGATLMTTVADSNLQSSGTTLPGSMLIGGLFFKGPGNFGEGNQFARTSILLSGGTIASADQGNIGATDIISGLAPGLNVAFVWGGKGTTGGTISTVASTTSFISVPSGSYFWLCTAGGAQPLSNEPFFVTGPNSTLNVNTSLAQYNDSATVGNGINISGSGTVVFNPPAGFPNLYSDNTNIVSGTLKVGGTGAIPYGVLTGGSISSNVELDGGDTVAGTLDLAGNSIFVNGLQGLSGVVAGAVINSATGTTATLTDLTLMGAATQASGASGSSITVYSGVLADNAGGYPLAGGGKLALVVGGTGSLTLTSSNTYSGGTTIGPVTAGTLTVAGNGSLILGASATWAAARSRSLRGASWTSRVTPTPATRSPAPRSPPGALPARPRTSAAALSCSRAPSSSTRAAR